VEVDQRDRHAGTEDGVAWGEVAVAQLVADDKSWLWAVRLVGPVWPLAVRVMPIVRSSFCWSVLEGMGCLAPSRRYLGAVAFWRKGDNDLVVVLSANVSM
jgi:hypothetical protein